MNLQGTKLESTHNGCQVKLTNPYEDSLKSIVLQGLQSHSINTQAPLTHHL